MGYISALTYYLFGKYATVLLTGALSAGGAAGCAKTRNSAVSFRAPSVVVAEVAACNSHQSAS